MEKLEAFDYKKIVRYGLRVLFLLLVLWVASSGLHWLLLKDDFYASVIPGDPVRMGMTPREVYAVLGTPDDTWAVQDDVRSGWFGNHSQWRHTGEVYLYYQRPVFGQNARLGYYYHKRSNRVKSLTVNIGSYATWSEAAAVVDQVTQYAHIAFAQKGAYTFQHFDDSIDGRFQVQKYNQNFYLDITINDIGIKSSETPYSVNLSQSLY